MQLFLTRIVQISFSQRKNYLRCITYTPGVTKQKPSKRANCELVVLCTHLYRGFWLLSSARRELFSTANHDVPGTHGHCLRRWRQQYFNALRKCWSMEICLFWHSIWRVYNFMGSNLAAIGFVVHNKATK